MTIHRPVSLVRSVLLATVVAWLPVAMAQAQTVKLFKIVSPKDEVVVGIDAAQLGSGAGPEVQRFAALLADKSPLTVWQYASHQEAGGTLVQAPLRQVAIFRNDLLRVEPYSSPLPVRPIAAR